MSLKNLSYYLCLNQHFLPAVQKDFPSQGNKAIVYQGLRGAITQIPQLETIFCAYFFSTFSAPSGGIYLSLFCGELFLSISYFPDWAIDFLFSSVLGKCERAERSIWFDSTEVCNIEIEYEKNVES